MSVTTQLQIRSLARDPSGQLASQAGALRRAENVVLRAPGVAESRPNFELLMEIVGTDARVKTLVEFSGEVLAVEEDAGTWALRRASTEVAYDLPSYVGVVDPVDYDSTETKFFQARGSLYATTASGVLKLDEVADFFGGLDAAGVDMVVVTDWLTANANYAGQEFCWAYVFVYVRKDANGYIRRSPPSERLVVTSQYAVVPNLATRVYTRGLLLSSDRIEVYRSRVSETGVANPEVYLSYTYAWTEDDLLAGYFTPPPDITTDDQLGAALYTNPSQGGALAAKYLPPCAQAVAFYQSCAWYGRATQKHRTSITIRSVGRSGPASAQSFAEFTSGSPVVVVGSAAHAEMVEGAYFTDNLTEGPTVAGTYVPALTRIFSVDAAPNITLYANALASGDAFAGMMPLSAPRGIESAIGGPGVHTSGSHLVYGLADTSILRVGMGWSNSATGPATAGSMTAADTRIEQIISATAIRIDIAAIGSGSGGNAYDCVEVDGVLFYAWPGNTLLGALTPVWDWPVRCAPYWSQNIGSETGMASFITTLAMAVNYWAVTHYFVGPEFKVRALPIGETNLDDSVVTGWADSIVFEELGIGGDAFVVDSSAPTAFTPTMPLTSSNDDKPGRVYWSSPDEPESVPVVNYVDVGSSAAPVLAFATLRNALLVFKTDGVYRITGSAPSSWSVECLDSAFRLVRPECVGVIDNTAFVWAQRGFFAVTESGVTSLSAGSLDEELRTLAAYVAADASTHGAWVLPWPERQLVLFGTPAAEGVEYTGKVYCFSLVTRAFSEWPVSWGQVASAAAGGVYHSKPFETTDAGQPTVSYEIRQSKTHVDGFDRTHDVVDVTFDEEDLTVVTIALPDLGQWLPRAGDMLSRLVGDQRQYRRITAVEYPEESGAVTLTLEAVFPE